MFDPSGENDRLPAYAPPALPLAPPTGAITSTSYASRLPSPPPAVKAPSLFDKQHRQDTLLALGSGLLTGQNFGDGLSAAAQNVMGLKKQLRVEQTKTHEFGGPDDAFDITTDPTTGQRTVRPVPEFVDYLHREKTKPKDVADMNGRAMHALQQLPEADRPAAYQAIRTNPAAYGVDVSTMPAQYDPHYAAMASDMGMTVSQAMTRQQAGDNAAAAAAARAALQADRDKRTGIYAGRSAAAIA
jgi:hypothetical protein